MQALPEAVGRRRAVRVLGSYATARSVSGVYPVGQWALCDLNEKTGPLVCPTGSFNLARATDARLSLFPLSLDPSGRSRGDESTSQTDEPAGALQSEDGQNTIEQTQTKDGPAGQCHKRELQTEWLSRAIWRAAQRSKSGRRSRRARWARGSSPTRSPVPERASMPWSSCSSR